MSNQQETRRSNKGKKRKDVDEDIPPGKDIASKQEYEIARWMRKNIQIKKTKFLSHTVEYFTACKAVDQLMDSPWAKPLKPGEDALFTTRESIVKYLDVMLRHKLFHRARKIVVPESELKSKKKKDKEKEGGGPEKETKKEDKPEKKKEDKDTTAAESSHAEGDKPEGNKDKKKKKKDESEKKKRKIRLDMHLEQRFVDGLDAYVWIYEPTPFYYYFFGFLVVVGVIAVCLFPLWPSFVRDWVYYLSVAAAGFLVFIIALAVVRVIVFSLLWCITFGNHHLWLLPNLTEDVGFFASFWPLYKYEYKGVVEPEEEEEDEEDEEQEAAEQKENEQDKDGNNPPPEEKDEKRQERSGTPSETESESSQPSQTGKDFEIVTNEDVEVMESKKEGS